MNRCHRVFLVFLFTILFVVPSTVLSGYTWTGVNPTDGADDLGRTVIDLGATVTWAQEDAVELTEGTISVYVPGYTGVRSLSYAIETGLRSVKFRTQLPPEAPSCEVSFSPSLAANQTVEITYEATGMNSGGYYSSKKKVSGTTK